MSRLPVRLTLRTYSPEAIAALNRDLFLKDDAAFLPAEEVLAAIEAGQRPTSKQAPTWFYHPDERVQLALLERETLTPLSYGRHPRNLRYMKVWATALAHAAAEGVVWTPVLDYISAVRDLWSMTDSGRSVILSREFAQYVPAVARAKGVYRSEQQLTEELADWVRDGDRRRIDPLLELRSDRFVAAALCCVRRISRRRAWEILERRPSVAPMLAGRIGDLSESFAAVLREWALADLLRVEGRLGNLPKNAIRFEKRRLAYGYHALREIYVSGGAKGERSFTDAEMRQLVSLLDAGGDPDVGPASLAAGLLARCANRLSETELLKIVPYLDVRTSQAITAVKAAHATPRVWQACLEHSPTPDVEEAVADLPDALRVPEIRSLLGRSGKASVLAKLIEDATGREFVRLFRKLARRDVDAAARVLKERPEHVSFLAPADLAPLLRSSDQRYRLTAITLLSDTTTDRRRGRARRL